MIRSPKITILSLDPGTKNYGYAVIQFDSTKQVRILKSGRLHKTVQALNKDLMFQVMDYNEAIVGLIEEFDVKLLIAERYMSRRMGGTTIECVNIMIGMILQIAHDRGLRCRIIPASQWKNEVSRVDKQKLESLYLEGKSQKITPHTIDAVMIGLYGRAVALRQKPFIGVKNSKVVESILNTGVQDIGIPVKPLPKRKKRRAK